MLYDIGLKIYSGVVAMAGLFNKKAKLWHKGRIGLIEKIRQSVKPGEDIAWFHAASLGEFEQGRPLIEYYREQHPDIKILVTFFSPSGYEIRKDYPGADYIFYMPIDTKANAREFIGIVRPKVAIFIKYEFWQNYLEQLHSSGAKVYIVSAIFRPEQLFFRSYGTFYRKQLKCFDYLFVQDRRSKELLSSIDITNVVVSGDTRFDRVFDIAASVKPISLVEQFVDGRELFIAGSTWEADDEVVASIADKNRDICYIIAPHEMGEAKITKLISRLTDSGHNPKRYTKIEQGEELSSYNILILDTIGILSSVYQYGRWAYIGGGFGVGIHNILEAATFGMPIMFGPNYGKFNEALELVAMGGAISIATCGEALDGFSRMKESATRESMAAICKGYIAENRGACSKIMNVIEK